MKRLVLLSALLFGCGGAPAGQESAAAPKAPTERPIPEDLRAEVTRSSNIGTKLYALDQASAIATDVLFANVEHPEEQGVVGYLPLLAGRSEDHQPDSFLVSFFTGDDPPQVAYEVRVPLEGPPTFQAFAPPQAVGADLAALIRARQLAILAMPASNQPINPVLIPAAGPGEVLVYLLAGTKQPHLAVFGRHFRARVPLGGSSVSEMKALSNSALEIPTKAPNGEPVEALVVTHVVTDFPLETHVFTSLLHEKPVYVSTRRGIWRVEGRRITFLGENEPTDAQ